MDLDPIHEFSDILPQESELERRTAERQSDQETSRPYVPYWVAPVMKLLLLIFVLLIITIIELITKTVG